MKSNKGRWAATARQFGINPHRRGFLTLRIVLALFAAFSLLAGLLLYSAIVQAREAARRSSCKCHFKQMGSALQNYHDVFGSFPPAYTVDAEGNRLHSWRTLILPFLNKKALYDSIDLSKPWDDPVNRSARQTAVSTYLCPSITNLPKNATVYAAALSPHGLFRGPTPVKTGDITDGTSNTVAVIEAPFSHAVEWMQPEDVTELHFVFPGPGFVRQHDRGMDALLADGTVRFISDKIDSKTRRALLTIAGGESVGEF